MFTGPTYAQVGQPKPKDNNNAAGEANQGKLSRMNYSSSKKGNYISVCSHHGRNEVINDLIDNLSIKTILKSSKGGRNAQI